MMRVRLAAAVAVFLAAAAAWADDLVYYRPAGAVRDVEVRGVIDTESPAGIRIKSKAGETEVPALEVRAVVYQSPTIASLEFRRPGGREDSALALPAREAAKRRELLDQALQGFRALDARAGSEANAHRYLQYRIARVLALQAREDPLKLDPAVAALTAYKSDFAGGWEIVPAMQLLGQLLEARGDAGAASKTYDELALLPGIPPELKQESQVQSVRMLLRGRKFAEAEGKLKALQASITREGPQRAFLDVCLVQSRMAQGNLAEAEPRLSAALKAVADPAVRAAAHNLLGDYYLRANKPQEAFWHYLHVDVLYNQDREEHAKALYNLARLFDKVKNDPVRAEDCLRRLRGPEFAGTSYQRQADEDRK
jgi:hypothetical protein